MRLAMKGRCEQRWDYVDPNTGATVRFRCARAFGHAGGCSVEMDAERRAGLLVRKATERTLTDYDDWREEAR